LKDLCERLRKAGLILKVRKFNFGKRSIRLLGHILEDGLIKPDREKVQAILDFETPKTKRQVRSFLGVSNFYRQYIENYSTKAFALTELTKKWAPEKVKWGEAEEKAFQQLKMDLCSEPVLIPPNPNKPYALYCDASNVGLGCVLLQRYDSDRERVVSFASRKLLERERSFSVAEKECACIVWALTHFECYLFDAKVRVTTDHHALQWLKSFSNNNPRLLRWSQVIERFNVQISYVRASQNSDADGLSRAFGDSRE